MTLDSRVQRCLDFLGASTALLFTAPLSLGIAAIIYLSEGRNVSEGRTIFYRNECYGKGGKKFILYKFRTFKPGQGGVSRERWLKEDNEPEYIWIGEFLRDNKLDELANFWNVLKGDMSMVGPRPSICETIHDDDTHQDELHTRRVEEGISEVKPGVTGYVQLGLYRGELGVDERIELEKKYISDEYGYKDYFLLIGGTIVRIGNKYCNLVGGALKRGYGSGNSKHDNPG